MQVWSLVRELRVLRPQLKIPCAATKTQCSQINNLLKESTREKDVLNGIIQGSCQGYCTRHQGTVRIKVVGQVKSHLRFPAQWQSPVWGLYLQGQLYELYSLPRVYDQDLAPYVRVLVAYAILPLRGFIMFNYPMSNTPPLLWWLALLIFKNF